MRPDVQNLAFRALLLATAVCSGMYVCAFEMIDIPVLPTDETEARQALADGWLDSALWKSMAPFYTSPICVPRGELVLLRDVVCDLPEDLPVSARALDRFVPWDATQRKRFFDAYPELLPFLPILSFDAGPAGIVPARAGFHFSRAGNSDTMRQYMLFSAGRQRRISANGRIDFTNAYGRWYRRTASIALPASWNLTGGNYSVLSRYRLLFGFFPERNRPDTSLIENWIYSASRTWNGVKLRRDRYTSRLSDTKWTGEIMVHHCETEQIALIEGSLSLSNHVAGHTGVSYLHTNDTAESTAAYYLHGGLSWRALQRWNGIVYAGCDLRNCGNIPWLCEIVNSSERNRFKMAVSFLPRGLHAPRSALVQRYMVRIKESEPCVDKQVFTADFLFAHRYSAMLSVTPHVSCIFTDTRPAYLAAVLDFAGSYPLEYNFRYAWLPIENGVSVEGGRHQTLFSCGFPLARRFRFDCTNTVRANSEGYWRIRTTVCPGFVFSPALHCTVLLIGTRSLYTPWEKAIGFRQMLTLQEKTFTDLRIEQEVPFASWETIRAYGRMSFLF